ncbi:response regulator [candidate division WWE3 bacterium]|uniref:Response regulator n=1 Tax=candidate division WWE3 bacterium TaxID=2053526 RepID=A0A955LKV9_UNCKA|nr:response regulator [candidate division WWE3 bacterium]
MYTLLIIEDDETLRKMYRTQFENAGYMVFEANEGKDGIIQAAREQPDFILLDLMMPVGMNGKVALKHLKDDPMTANIPVAILSVVPDDAELHIKDDGDEKFMGKVVGYWRKDVLKPKDVLEKVTNYLEAQLKGMSALVESE